MAFWNRTDKRAEDDEKTLEQAFSVVDASIRVDTPADDLDHDVTLNERHAMALENSLTKLLAAKKTIEEQIADRERALAQINRSIRAMLAAQDALSLVENDKAQDITEVTEPARRVPRYDAPATATELLMREADKVSPDE